MKKPLRFTCFIISAIIALSAISCNSSTTLNDNEQEAKENSDTITANTVLENTEEKSDKLANELILVNPNGIIEESKRAAAEVGVFMPETVMNGAPAGTYPIQGFLLSASTPSDTFGNGMSIIYRLSDGSLFVFDGGGGYVRYMLYKCLKDLSGGGKIKVAAWVMTHAHGDHFYAMKGLLEGVHKYDFEIQEFWYNRSNKREIF